MKHSRTLVRLQSLCSSILCLAGVIAAMLGVGGALGEVQAATSAQTPSLVFSTYLGGSVPFASQCNAQTFAQNTACDASGNIYVTGGTQVADLPVINAYQPTPAAGSTMSAFVAKYDPNGRLLWCTYLGGNNQSMGIGVATTPDGGVAIVGLTSSSGTRPFPTLNAYQRTNNGQSDYFVTVYDANGRIRYSTYLGGSGVEGGPGSPFVDNSSNGNNVAVDSRGLVYFTGVTPSGGGSGAIKFPVTSNALQNSLKGGTDAFLCIVDPNKSGTASLIYSSFLGGNHGEQGHSVAVDAFGRCITVAGYTASSNFPTTANAYRSNAPPAGFYSNGFVTQFQSSLPGWPTSRYTMRYSTYVGANTSVARDDTYGMVVDSKGIIVAVGRTESAFFPMTRPGVPRSIFDSAPYLMANVSGDEPYVVKINPALSGNASLVYSTYLGGASTNGQWGGFATSVGTDARGTIHVAGETWAPGELYIPVSSPEEAPYMFPYTYDAIFTSLQGSYDALFMQIAPNGKSLSYSTYLGGKNNDRTYGLAVDPSGNVILSGLTFSSNFPLLNAAQGWPGNTGLQNAFITKFSANYVTR